MATQAVEVEVAAKSKRPSLRERLDLGSGLTPYLLVLPTIIVILVVAGYPIVNSFWLSLQDTPLSSSSNFVGLQNYVQVLGSSEFRTAIGVTFGFTIIAVFLETVFGLGIALLINATFPGRGLVRAAILVPWAFPTVISAQIWYLMYNDRTGIVSYILQQLRLLPRGGTLLQSSNGIILASIITDVWKTTPFMALLLLAGLQVIPSELYEAAGVDGSTRWQQFWRITLPMLKNALLIALMFRLLDALRAFDLFYILTGGGREIQTMALYSYANMFQGTTVDFAPGVAAAVVLFLICAVVALVIVSMTRISQN